MEQYIYISIIFFSLIIFQLYIYITYEKLSNAYRSNKIKKYSQRIESYINNIIDEINAGHEPTTAILDDLKYACMNKMKREVVEEHILNRMENLKGVDLSKHTELCDYIGVVQYEINNLENKNYFKKALAAKRLGEFRSKDAVPALLAQIHVRNNDVIYNILLALAKIGDEEAFVDAFASMDSSISLSERSLIEIVDSFEGNKYNIYKHMINTSNRFIAGVFIKSAGNARMISLSKAISKYLSSENKELRIAAVKAIGNMGAEEYVNDLIKLLKDHEWEVRALSAKALNNFTDNEILLPLRDALSDAQWHVRFNAATTILNHEDGMSIVDSVLDGNDTFAKDIIMFAIENSGDRKTSFLKSHNV